MSAIVIDMWSGSSGTNINGRTPDGVHPSGVVWTGIHVTGFTLNGSGGVQSNTFTGTDDYAWVDSQQADHSVTAPVQSSTLSNTFSGITARQLNSGSATCLQFRINYDGSNLVALYNVVGGSSTLAQSSSFTPSINTNYTLLLMVHGVTGTNVTATLNGGNTCTGSDTTSNTNGGLYNFTNTSNSTTFGTFEIDSIVLPASSSSLSSSSISSIVRSISSSLQSSSIHPISSASIPPISSASLPSRSSLSPSSIVISSSTTLGTQVIAVAQFGSNFAGLAGTIGYTLYLGNGTVYQGRTTAGIFEMDVNGNGTGSYITTLNLVGVNMVGIVWDSGGSGPVTISDEVNPGNPGTTVVNFGTGYTGLTGTVGYTLFNPDGTIYQSRMTTGIAELIVQGAGTGIYIAQVSNAIPVGIVWDTGGANPVYAADQVLLCCRSSSVFL